MNSAASITTGTASFWLLIIFSESISLHDEAILPTFAVSTGELFNDGPIPWMSDNDD